MDEKVFGKLDTTNPKDIRAMEDILKEKFEKACHDDPDKPANAS